MCSTACWSWASTGSGRRSPRPTASDPRALLPGRVEAAAHVCSRRCQCPLARARGDSLLSYVGTPQILMVLTKRPGWVKLGASPADATNNPDPAGVLLHARPPFSFISDSHGADETPWVGETGGVAR